MHRSSIPCFPGFSILRVVLFYFVLQYLLKFFSLCIVTYTAPSIPCLPGFPVQGCNFILFCLYQLFFICYFNFFHTCGLFFYVFFILLCSFVLSYLPYYSKLPHFQFVLLFITSLFIYLYILRLFILALRFICLIDTLYDHKIRLVASGEKPYWELFKVRYTLFCSVLFFH